MRISNKLYEETIRRAFKAHAGDDNPDPEAIKEVQKAVASFVRNFLTQAIERSLERDKSGDKVYAEDILYALRDNPKYMDVCAKTLCMYHYIRQQDDLKKKINYINPNFEATDQQEEFSSEEIERLQDGLQDDDPV